MWIKKTDEELQEVAIKKRNDRILVSFGYFIGISFFGTFFSKPDFFTPVDQIPEHAIGAVLIGSVFGLGYFFFKKRHSSVYLCLDCESRPKFAGEEDCKCGGKFVDLDYYTWVDDEKDGRRSLKPTMAIEPIISSPGVFASLKKFSKHIYPALVLLAVLNLCAQISGFASPVIQEKVMPAMMMLVFAVFVFSSLYVLVTIARVILKSGFDGKAANTEPFKKLTEKIRPAQNLAFRAWLLMVLLILGTIAAS